VLGAVVAEGLALTAAGLAVGLVAALTLNWAARGLLFGVGPADPATYAAVALALAATALMACALPAWRALRMSPTEVLRSE
jgi:ABC-type antimicrobial peptide transport system permease subunit